MNGLGLVVNLERLEEGGEMEGVGDLERMEVVEVEVEVVVEEGREERPHK